MPTQINKFFIIKHFATLVLLLAGFFFIGGCKSNFIASKQSKNNKSLDEAIELDFQYTLVEASKQKMLGNYEDAIALYTKCLGLNANSSAVRYELANLFIKMNDLAGALELMQKAVERNPQNRWYQERLAELYFEQQQIDDAIRRREVIIDSFPNYKVNYYDLAAIYSSRSDFKNAIAIYNKVESRFGSSEALVLARNRTYFAMGKYEKVEQGLQTLIEAAPGEARYYSLLADFYTAISEYEKALQAYDKVIELDPDNGYVHLQLANFYRVQKQYNKAFKQLEYTFHSTNVEVETKLEILASNFYESQENEKLYDQAYRLIEILLEVHEGNPDAHGIVAEYMIRDEKYEQAQQQLEKVIEVQQNDFDTWIQLIAVADFQLRDFDKMLKHSEQAITYFPNQFELFLYKGIAAYHLHKNEVATEALSYGLDIYVDDKPDVLAQFYYYIAEANHRTGNHSESDAAFEQLLKIQPDNDVVANNYSYYLSLRGVNINRAVQLIEKVIKRNPNNPTYLDTYGWILYKQNKYEQAVEYLQKAVDNGGNTNATIVEHLGDAFYKTGNQTKALELWKKAQKTGNGSDKLSRKISQQKLIE